MGLEEKALLHHSAPDLYIFEELLGAVSRVLGKPSGGRHPMILDLGVKDFWRCIVL